MGKPSQRKTHKQSTPPNINGPGDKWGQPRNPDGFDLASVTEGDFRASGKSGQPHNPDGRGPILSSLSGTESGFGASRVGFDQQRSPADGRASGLGTSSVTEGDLSGGGGTISQTAVELGLKATMELLEGHLRQAEHNLAAQHAGVLRLVSQLFGGSTNTAEEQQICNWRSGSTLDMPESASDPIGDLRDCKLDRLDTLQIEPPLRKLKSRTPPRPSSVGRPGSQRPVPQPPAEAPRMTIPGQMPEENYKGPLGNPPSEDPCNRPRRFEVSRIFKCEKKNEPSYHEYHDAATMNLESHLSDGDAFVGDMADSVNRAGGVCKHFIQHPNSFMRCFWEILTMMLVLYDLIMVPFDFFEPEKTPLMLTMTWVTRIFWTLDIPLSFSSGFVTVDGTIEMRPGRIALKYIKSWFFLDIVVTSIDWVEEALGKAMQGADVARIGKITKIFRIIRLARLARLAKVGEIVNLLTERLPSEKLVIFIDILKLIVIMLGLGHLVACAWYWIGVEMRPVDRTQWNWLQTFDFADEPLDYKYIMSLRWALSQFAGGMDEVTPISLAEHIFAGMVYIFAFWSGTVFLSILTSHFTQLYILGNQQSQQVNVMRRYLSQNGISKALALRVTRNAQHCLKIRQRATPEAAVGLLELVSEPLRIELHYEMFYPMLGRHPFFAEYMRFCPFVVRRICHDAMNMSTFSKDDVIFHFGEAATKMLIVRSGALLYSWGSSSSTVLSEGRWLSEPPLWTHWAHRGVLTACEDSIVFAVSADLFQGIVSKFELAVFDPGAYGRSFVRNLNKVAVEELTDLPTQASPNSSMLSVRTMSWIRHNSGRRFKSGISSGTALYAVEEEVGGDDLEESTARPQKAMATTLVQDPGRSLFSHGTGSTRPPPCLKMNPTCRSLDHASPSAMKLVVEACEEWEV